MKDAGNMVEKCKGGLEMLGVYLIDPKDCVFKEDGTFLRLKRKQKGFNRDVVYVDRKNL